MIRAQRATPRPWTDEESAVILEECESGGRTLWSRRAAARLPGRTEDQCWSRAKTMRDRANIGDVPVDRFSTAPWALNIVPEEIHLDQLVEAGGFPRFNTDDRTGLMTSELVDPWGYSWNPA